MSLLNTIVPLFHRQPADRRGESDSQPAGPTVKPAYTVTETAEAWGVTVHLPGVTKDGLDLLDEDGVLTVRGRRAWTPPADWTPLHLESTDAAFELALEHDHTVDADKIHAELRDGVLRLSLPKQEAAKPRRIAVN